MKTWWNRVEREREWGYGGGEYMLAACLSLKPPKVVPDDTSVTALPRVHT